jgi:hypothetical protein
MRGDINLYSRFPSTVSKMKREMEKHSPQPCEPEN